MEEELGKRKESQGNCLKEEQDREGGKERGKKENRAGCRKMLRKHFSDLVMEGGEKQWKERGREDGKVESDAFRVRRRCPFPPLTTQ